MNTKSDYDIITLKREYFEDGTLYMQLYYTRVVGAISKISFCHKGPAMSTVYDVILNAIIVCVTRVYAIAALTVL